MQAKEAGKLVQKEEEQLGSVPADVYSAYIQAAGGWCLAVTVLSGVLCGQGLQAAASAWISYWSLGCNQGEAGLVHSAKDQVGHEVFRSFGDQHQHLPVWRVLIGKHSRFFQLYFCEVRPQLAAEPQLRVQLGRADRVHWLELDSDLTGEEPGAVKFNQASDFEASNKNRATHAHTHMHAQARLPKKR